MSTTACGRCLRQTNDRRGGQLVSAPKVDLRAVAGDVGIEVGAIYVSNLSHGRRLRDDSNWLVPARSSCSVLPAFGKFDPVCRTATEPADPAQQE